MPLLADVAAGLLDLLAPECCALCGATRDGRAWCAAGPVVRGLRPWDTPHLCHACATALRPDPLRSRLAPAREGGPWSGPVWAARPTDAALVAVVGAWKYRGLRGLAWPLASLAAAAASLVREDLAGPLLLVPVPLHRRRRRARGFNQAAVLAALVARHLAWPVADGLLARRRATPQQARLGDDAERLGNVAGSCSARAPGRADALRQVLLVDDIVTSGATVSESARALAAAGWRPRGALALGARAAPSG